MANLTFQQVKAANRRVKTFNVSGIHWDADIDLIEFYRKKRPNSTDLEVFIQLWNDDEKKFVLSEWQIVFWSTIFALIVLVSLFGNLVVVWTIASNKTMRNITNCLIVNLAISDMTQSALATIFSFIFLLTQEWPVGPEMCYITQYMAVVSVSCSAFTLTAISLERYLAIMYPLRKRKGKWAIVLSIAFLWIASFCIALPHAMYAKYHRLDQGERQVCILEWPDGTSFQSSQEFIYNGMLTIVTYCLPLLVMMFTYARAGIKLWRNNSIGEPTEQQLQKFKSRKKVVKMLIVSVIAFLLCWLPYHGYFLASWLFPQINHWEHMQVMYLGIFWLAMSSSMHSPVIYCIMNAKFRAGFQQVFAFLCCCRLKRRRNRATISTNFISSAQVARIRHLDDAEPNGRSFLVHYEIAERVAAVSPRPRRSFKRAHTMDNIVCTEGDNFSASKKISKSASDGTLCEVALILATLQLLKDHNLIASINHQEIDSAKN